VCKGFLYKALLFHINSTINSGIPNNHNNIMVTALNRARKFKKKKQKPPQNIRCQKFHSGDKQILHTRVQNLLPWATWCPGFVHSFFKCPGKCNDLE